MMKQTLAKIYSSVVLLLIVRNDVADDSSTTSSEQADIYNQTMGEFS